ncbi:MAG: preprotein translocase subunit SecG, partial [Alphaproteobacteria bacterium]|nr:preprotein translocase subunit SecG [Alphaproteobacteria bacterium]
MQQVIIAIHLMVVTALVILVLYQKSEGGALGMGGGSGVFTGRGQANALTRATGILATIFFITSIALTVLPAWERRSEGGDDWTKALDPGSIQIKELPKSEGKTEGKGEQGAPEKSPEPGKDSIFDQLQRAQQQRQQSAPAGAPPAAAPPAAEAP